MLLFDGSLLHGVVPSAAPSHDQYASSSGEIGSEPPARITLMLGWWPATPVQQPIMSPPPAADGTNVGPNMPMPVPAPALPAAAPASKTAKKKRRKMADSAESPTTTTSTTTPNWVSDLSAPVKEVGGSAGAGAGASKGSSKNVAVPAPLEHCASVWSAIAGADCKDPEEGSEAEARLIAAQQQLVSKWYVRGAGDIKLGVQRAAAMAAADDDDDDEDDDGGGAGGAGGYGSSEGEYGSGSDSDDEYKCEVCGLIGDDYNVMVQHEKDCAP